MFGIWQSRHETRDSFVRWIKVNVDTIEDAVSFSWSVKWCGLGTQNVQFEEQFYTSNVP